MTRSTAVILQVSVRRGRLYADLASGPILRYCPACGHVSPTPYPYSGSRYGQVGGYACERCGADIALTDGDCRPPIHYSVSSRAAQAGHHPGVSIWHEDLYGIAPRDFLRIGAWTGLAFFEGVDSAGIPFARLMERLEAWVAEHGPATIERVDEAKYGEWMEVVFGDAAERNEGGLRPRDLARPFTTVIPEPFRRWLALYYAAWLHRRPADGA